MEIIKLIVLAIGLSTAAVLAYGAYRFNFGESARATPGSRSADASPKALPPGSLVAAE